MDDQSSEHVRPLVGFVADFAVELEAVAAIVATVVAVVVVLAVELESSHLKSHSISVWTIASPQL